MDASTAPQDDRCPRCGGTFHCGARDAAPCPCGGVSLDAATQTLLRERYTACLCLTCLRQLAATPTG
ncbi:MAG: cysteine-rich CWC family protein [Rhizobacter sp.]|nr:cysteine-rich CWC family protein [Rhizobacter sp.]